MNILMMGCGEMGFALLQSMLLNKNIKAGSITIVKPSPLKTKVKGVKVFNNIAALPKNYQPDLIIYAVKPVIVDDVAKETKHLLKKGGLALSIAAGKTIADFHKTFGKTTAVVRAMPNLPISVGEGVTGLYAAKNVTAAQKKLCNELFKHSGLTLWLKTEAGINKIIAVAGSSTAYVYAFTIALEKAAVSYGFDSKLSAHIAGQVLRGAAALLKESGLTPGQLNKSIATPGGSTQAALDTLAKGNALDKLVKKAADAAKNRFK
ncbi:pyrroline-5-carboxylate reductase [Elusimicrobium simillimum]|uniref:pyrroline-5-carboxylate reductase family protein n=1 Tax=Elusimicrobium simillimum TaxID=3143438 RepID=UPI003C6F74F1